MTRTNVTDVTVTATLDNTSNDVATAYFVQIGSIVPASTNVSPGQTISLSAQVNPDSQSFPTNIPVWSAGAGTFSPTNKGATVTWNPPSNTFSGIVTVTASDCGTNVTAALNVIDVKIKTLEFTSDHNLICNGANVTTVGSRYPDVEWNPGANPAVNAPITHTAGTTNLITATLICEANGIPQEGLPFTLSGISSESALNFGMTGTLTNSGTVSFTLTASNVIGRQIRTFEQSIAWSIVVGGVSVNLGNTGPHKVYTTIGTPGSATNNASVPNPSRMALAVERVAAAIAAAGTNANAYTCYPQMVWNIMSSAGTYSLSNGSLDDVTAWNLPAITAGSDCIAISRFVRNICMVEGIPGTFVPKTYIAYYCTQNDPTRASKAVEGNLKLPRIGPGDLGIPLAAGLNSSWRIALADSNCENSLNANASPGTVGCGPGGFNAFEAAVVYTDTAGKAWYFPAGVRNNPRYDTADAVVQIFQTLAWVGLVDDDNDPTSEPIPLVVQVDYTYTRPNDVDLCP